MKSVLLISQIVVGISLTALILLQAKGTGLGRTFGSIAYHSKRGVEGLIFKLTVVLTVVFVLLSVITQLA